MVENIGGASPYSNLQPFGGSGPVDPEQVRPVQPELPKSPGPVERLRDKIEAGTVDTAQLTDRAEQAFGEAGRLVVTETGEADLNSLSTLIAQNRSDTTRSDVISRFGEEASRFVDPKGDIDQAGLRQFLNEQGNEQDIPKPRTSFGGGAVTGYSPQGQSNVSAQPNFLSVVA